MMDIRYVAPEAWGSRRRGSPPGRTHAPDFATVLESVRSVFVADGESDL
jgi:hypothetical protein